MLNFIYHNFTGGIHVTEHPPGDLNALSADEFLVNRNNMTSYDHALEIMTMANVEHGVEETARRFPYLAVDRGNGVSPRYDVIERPQLGDSVSKSFNGDCYPCGYITKISSSLRRIETSDGTVFYAKMVTGEDGDKRLSGAWGEKLASPFRLTRGHISKRNPHF